MSEINILVLGTTSQYITLQDDDLTHETCEKIIELLVSQQAPPASIWLEVAKAYARKQNFSCFVKILESLEDWVKASPDLMKKFLADDPRCMDKVYHSLAQYYFEQCSYSYDLGKHKAFLDKGCSYAERIRTPEGDVSKAVKSMQYFWEGLFDLAIAELRDVQITSAIQSYVLAQSLRGMSYFRLERYKDALACFKSVLEKDVNCPASIRVAIGMCFRALGKDDLAVIALDRALELEPENINAIIAKSSIDRMTTTSVEIMTDSIHQTALKLLSIQKTQPLPSTALFILAEDEMIKWSPIDAELSFSQGSTLVCGYYHHSSFGS